MLILDTTLFQAHHTEHISEAQAPSLSRVTRSHSIKYIDRRVTLPTTALSSQPDLPIADDKIHFAPPPHSPRSEASASSPPSPRPPPFSSLYFPTDAELDHIRAAVTGTVAESLLATAPAPSFEEALAEGQVESKAEAETKAALAAQDTKGESSGKGVDDGEPPPPYTEGSSPLESFTYVMASAGGPASIITQVQQSPGAPINTLGGGTLPCREEAIVADRMQQEKLVQMSISHSISGWFVSHFVETRIDRMQRNAIYSVAG